MGLLSFQTTKKVFGGGSKATLSFSPSKKTTQTAGKTGKTGKIVGSKVATTHALDVPANAKAMRLQNKTERTKSQQQQSSRGGFHRASAGTSNYSLSDDYDGIVSRGLSENQFDDLYGYDFCDDMSEYHGYDINHELTSSGSDNHNKANNNNSNGNGNGNGNNLNIINNSSNSLERVDEVYELDHYRIHHMSKHKTNKTKSKNKSKATTTHQKNVKTNASIGLHSPTSVQDFHMGDPSFATPEVTRDLIKQYVCKIWNDGDVSIIPLVCSPKIRFNSTNGATRMGHQGLLDMVLAVRDGLADFCCEIHSMVVEENKAFCRFRWSGKHTGVFFGYPPTGKRVKWLGATEFTCVDGYITKVFELSDMKTLEEQLGLASFGEEEEDYGSVVQV